MNTWNNIRAVYLLALSRLCAAVLWFMRQADRLPRTRQVTLRARVGAANHAAASKWHSQWVTNWWCPDCGAICSSGKTHTCPTVFPQASARGTKNAS